MVVLHSLIIGYDDRTSEYDCRSIEEVYNDKENWKTLSDNHKFLFGSTIEAVLKRLVLRDTYRHNHIVESNEDLRDVSTNLENPSTISVIQPYMIISNDGVEVYHLLDSSACANIIKVAKFDFKIDDDISGDSTNAKYTFCFGQRAQDIQTKDSVVVVGQTRTYAYIISERTMLRDGRLQIALKPKQRHLKFLKVSTQETVLDFTVTNECAKMEEYVIQFSE